MAHGLGACLAWCSHRAAVRGLCPSAVGICVVLSGDFVAWHGLIQGRGQGGSHGPSVTWPGSRPPHLLWCLPEASDQVQPTLERKRSEPFSGRRSSRDLVGRFVSPQREHVQPGDCGCVRAAAECVARVWEHRAKIGGYLTPRAAGDERLDSSCTRPGWRWVPASPCPCCASRRWPRVKGCSESLPLLECFMPLFGGCSGTWY